MTLNRSFTKFINIILLMIFVNELLTAPPFDLYELSLFHLLARSKSFTKAAEQAGLTQSAVTRQIHGMETQLGVRLFERTTRHVALSPAGKMLFENSATILSSTDELIRQLRYAFDLVPPTLRVGVARSIGLAYLPGYFFAFQRKFPSVQLRVSQDSSAAILAAVEARLLDVGLVCPPRRLPSLLRITHRFQDEFTIVCPPKIEISPQVKSLKRLLKVLPDTKWLLIDKDGNTGHYLRAWLQNCGAAIEPAMELDSFDAIVNLVSLGLGISIVPHRVLPLYAQRRTVQRLNLTPRFSRELGVVVRKNRQPAEHLLGFIDNILF
jgi:DNA-binding transcriptional LysR family regulator